MKTREFELFFLFFFVFYTFLYSPPGDLMYS